MAVDVALRVKSFFRLHTLDLLPRMPFDNLQAFDLSLSAEISACTRKGGILCDEMGLGKTAATLVLHLIHPARTPAPGVPLDEKEWGRIGGHQVIITQYYFFIFRC